MSDQALPKICDLDSIYPGGVTAPPFRSDLDWICSELAVCEQRLAAPVLMVEEMEALVRRIEPVGLMACQLDMFTQLILILNNRDSDARVASGVVKSLQARHGSLLSSLDKHLLALSDADLDCLVNAAGIEVTGQALMQRRNLASARLPSEQEKVIRALAPDGLLGWGDVYHIVRSRPRESEAQLLASALNHIAGFRNAVYHLRGWTSVVKEPLANQRMREESLDAMWAALDANKEPLLRYIKRKAKQSGRKSLPYSDLFISGGNSPATWKEITQQVEDAFHDFDPEMANFARIAFDQGMVDFSEGDGRSPVNMALPLPSSRTFQVIISSRRAETLGHELGHAYSYTQMWDTPTMSMLLPIPFTLIEVPSTFAQLLVSKYNIQRADDPEERLHHLDEYCSDLVWRLLWTRVLFDFERAFYEQRMQAPLTTNQICDTFVGCVDRTFGETITDVDPYGWVKMHLLGSNDWPFYNFPYTVAHLLASALYDQWRHEGRRFPARYKAVMRDTATNSVETWAEKHLGVDLSRPESWLAAINLALEDVQTYLQLVDA